jgi:hypothetical protein
MLATVIISTADPLDFGELLMTWPTLAALVFPKGARTL